MILSPKEGLILASCKQESVKTSVRPKKSLGQHFLKDQNIARTIVDLLQLSGQPDLLIEIGPGTGVLTQYLLQKPGIPLLAMDVDMDSVNYLKNHFPANKEKFILQDFLKWHPVSGELSSLAVIGNFPYNISSQIFFHILEMKAEVCEVVCMLQREVAQRISAGPGSKEYGILSVLLQSRYQIQYAFTVDEHVFNPPPKVKSGVIRLELIPDKVLSCKFSSLAKVVKQAFNMRRKTLRNALKPMGIPAAIAENQLLDKRAEQLSVQEFEMLACLFESDKQWV
jgi:16S rRNA (adenine1518-N6/adenine1519-N6)-dimethyltransferase